MEDIEDFTFNTQKLIIRTRLDLEPEFQEGKKKKSVLGAKVLSKMKEQKPDIMMTREQINRKYLNLYTTYKRIKSRNNSTGRNATTWEFYDMFDEVYGSKHSINPPLKNLQSSLNINCDIENIETNFEESFGSTEILTDDYCPQKKKRQKLNQENNMLNFLKEEAKKDDERHKEIIEIERRKLEVEQERVKAAIDLKNALQKLLEK